ncbi:MAG: hypothetical protein P1U74_10055 [Legionellaceae bacterium]|nr:hypothetical protein [Legionellaceae bacterium]
MSRSEYSLVTGVTTKHFLLTNTWDDLEKDNDIFSGVIDPITNNRYLLEPISTTRKKHFVLFLVTPFIHTLAAIIKMSLNILKLITFYHFWKNLDHVKTDHMERRKNDILRDIFHILFAPLAVILLELVTIFGMILPKNGRKLYASIERLAYGDYILPDSIRKYMSSKNHRFTYPYFALAPCFRATELVESSEEKPKKTSRHDTSMHSSPKPGNE